MDSKWLIWFLLNWGPTLLVLVAFGAVTRRIMKRSAAGWAQGEARLQTLREMNERLARIETLLTRQQP